MRLFKKKVVVSSAVAAPDEVDPGRPAPTQPPPAGSPEAAGEPEDLSVTEFAPADVGLSLATRLAAIDQAELTAAQRDIASPGGKGLLDKLRAMEGAVWVLGSVEDPVGWTSLELLPGAGIVRGTVLPDHRGAGLARELLAAPLLERARESGVRELRATVFADSPAETLLTDAGWQPMDSPDYVIRRLDLRTTVERRFRIVEDARQFAAGYTIARAERFADEHEQPEGAAHFRVVARLGATETGYSELVVYDEMPEFGLEGDTFVQPEHRGHRLGLLMRAEIIRWVEFELSRVRVVQTRTPVDDMHTLAQLDRLGARGAGFRRDLHVML